MEFTGMIENVTRDWKTDRVNVTFSCNEESVLRELVDLKDSLLSIKAKKYRKKRSLDANALLWHCLGEIANSLNADKWDVYLTMLKRYGKYTYVCVKPNMVEAMKMQWRECEVVGDININGTDAVQMLCYFGSSTYDTKEFSTLLDGVVSEMKEMGLPTPTSKEMLLAIESVEKRLSKVG